MTGNRWRDDYSEDAVIDQIDSLFYEQGITEAKDQDVIITIRAKRGQVVIEECRVPFRPQSIGAPAVIPAWEQRYYRINLRNPEPPPGSFIMEIKFSKQFTYYRLGSEPHSVYYKKTEGWNKMQFFMPETTSWGESVYSDAEDYANQGGHARMCEVSFTDLPDVIQEFERDCE
jgi:hypothetical protein